MNYTEYQNSESKTRLDYLVIEQDYCGNSFGISPCVASGTKCYNTISTCTDYNNFNKGIKDYSFINNDVTPDIAQGYFPARPYIKSISDIPTEIKEDNTVVRRLKISLYDELDLDIGIDPYYKDRSSTQGYYWRKWLARNKNYKGRTIKLYDGFAGLNVSEFKLKFVGKIQKITYNKSVIMIEATDLLSELSKYEYPLKTSYQLLQDLPNVHQVTSEAEMLKSNASQNDFVERTDFRVIPLNSVSRVEVLSGAGEFSKGIYEFMICAYDAQDRVFARSSYQLDLLSSFDESRYEIRLNWDAVTNASYYQVYKKELHNGSGYINSAKWILDTKTQNTARNIYTMEGTEKDVPTQAENIYRLTTSDPTEIDNWEQYQQPMTVEITVDTDLEDEGYFKVDDEIIYFSSKNTGVISDTLKGLRRHQLNTDPEAHSVNTVIYSLLMKDYQNPFYLLEDILTLPGISSEYLDPKFEEYKNNWDGINFNTNLITKETDLSVIYFDAVNALDCMSWQGEDGLIKILKHSEKPTTYKKVTDDATIILNSGSFDLNESSRYTRWLQYWNRTNLDENLDSNDAYSRVNAKVDVDAEREKEYNEQLYKIYYTTWINEGGGTEEELNAYIDDQLEKRRVRMRDSKMFYTCSLTKKDNDILLGEIILLSTNDIQDINGNAIVDKEFRLIKKIPSAHNFTAKFKQIEKI